ncbi:substrate-binding domain-containing protein [Sulfitobacter sediminilitoris]|uniref:substrate-binding domain-containing protein n=1 Tax=Sulfitobacter sediminilitoris TaxID=2698830 RepID=UPI003617B200
MPDDITVTGIGDFKGSREFEPALTTVRIPARQIGAKAADVIAHKIITPDDSIEGQLVVPDLMVRNTSGPPSSGA